MSLCRLVCEYADSAFLSLQDQYKDSTLIMQLLKDNLTLWNETDDGELEVVDMDA